MPPNTIYAPLAQPVPREQCPTLLTLIKVKRSVEYNEIICALIHLGTRKQSPRLFTLIKENESYTYMRP